MPMSAQQIEKLILEKLPDAEVSIRDLAGDGDHQSETKTSSRRYVCEPAREKPSRRKHIPGRRYSVYYMHEL